MIKFLKSISLVLFTLLVASIHEYSAQPPS